MPGKPKSATGRKYRPQKKNLTVAVKNVMRGLVEKKIKDYYNSAALSTSGNIHNLNQITQGDGESERIGLQVEPTWFRCYLGLAMAATAEDQVVRVILFRDKRQVSDTSPTVSDVLESVSPNAHRDNANRGRFQFLKDYMLVLHGSRELIAFTFNKKLSGKIGFNGATSTDIEKGGLYLLSITDGGTNPGILQINARLHYSDL